MTSSISSAEPASASPAAKRLPVPPRPRSTGRIIGIDIVRGLAVFGMYSAHIGPGPSVGGPVGFLSEAARGRSSALFRRARRIPRW